MNFFPFLKKRHARNALPDLLLIVAWIVAWMLHGCCMDVAWRVDHETSPSETQRVPKGGQKRPKRLKGAQRPKEGDEEP